jgi:thioredoxin-related protein
MKLNNLLILAFVLVLSVAFATEPNEGKIKWMSIEEAEKASKQNPRPIFVDVYTDWCGWCKKMDKATFENAGIVDYVNKNYYAVKLDAENEKQITFMGKKMTEAELASSVFKVQGYPTIVFIKKDFSKIEVAAGYQTPESFNKMLASFSAETGKN